MKEKIDKLEVTVESNKVMLMDKISQLESTVAKLQVANRILLDTVGQRENVTAAESHSFQVNPNDETFTPSVPPSIDYMNKYNLARKVLQLRPAARMHVGEVKGLQTGEVVQLQGGQLVRLLGGDVAGLQTKMVRQHQYRGDIARLHTGGKVAGLQAKTTDKLKLAQNGQMNRGSASGPSFQVHSAASMEPPNQSSFQFKNIEKSRPYN